MTFRKSVLSKSSMHEKPENYIKEFFSISTVLILTASLMFTIPTAAAETANVKIYFQVIELHAEDVMDIGWGQSDFFWKITISCSKPRFTLIKQSSIPYQTNCDHLYPNQFLVFDIPDTSTIVSIKIEVFDDDGGGIYDICDVTNSGNAAVLSYYLSSRTWTGYDFRTDTNGYGLISGTEDGSTGHLKGEKDAAMYFFISSGQYTPKKLEGYIKDNSGNPIGGATIKLWAWTCDPERDLYVTTTSSSTGYWSLTWTQGITTLMGHAYKAGYWQEKMNISMDKNGLGRGDFSLPMDCQTGNSFMVIFASVNPEHTQVYMQYDVGHTATHRVYAYAAGSGFDKTYQSSVTVERSSWDTPCLIRQKLVWITGIYWADGGSRANQAWSTGEVPPGIYQDEYFISDPTSYDVNLPGVWIERLTTFAPPLQCEKSDSSSSMTQIGFKMSIGIGLPGGFSISADLDIGIQDTDAESYKLRIRIDNIDPAGATHDYAFWLEGGIVLHCWEVS